MSDTITRLEEHIAHQSVLLDELNEVLTGQRTEIDVLNRRVAMLMQRAAEQEADTTQGIPMADQKPPHW
ncbi:MAG: SlyX family protein [Paracoccaceae bacterium]